MAGHSKWKKIQHKKAKEDSKKAKIYSAYSRDISNSAKVNPNPASNLNLKNIIQMAKRDGVPKEVIEKAIDSAHKKIEGEEILYSGFGPNGSAFLLKCFVNNKNKVSSEIKSIFNKFNCTMSNCMHLFTQKGVLELKDKKFEDLSEDLSELIEDFEEGGLFFFNPKNFDKVLHLTKDLNVENCLITYFSNENIVLENLESPKKMEELLNEIDEVEEVITNFD